MKNRVNKSNWTPLLIIFFFLLSCTPTGEAGSAGILVLLEPLAHGEVLVHSLVLVKLEGSGGEGVLLVVTGYADLLVLFQHA